MKPYKVTNKYIVFPGIIYCWSILIFIAVICFPYMASQISEGSANNSSTSITEGSAHGSLKEILGIFDDDSSDDDVIIDDSEDDGGDGAADRGSAIVQEMTSENLSTPLYSLKVMCFRCHGDGISGCDVNTMMRDIQSYSAFCIGKCMNVSSGSTAVYDCAHDMLANMDTCLQNGDTEICFCSEDFCNGPSLARELYTSFSKPFYFPNLSLPLDGSYFSRKVADHSNKSININIEITNGSRYQSFPNETDIISNGSRYESFLTETNTNLNGSNIESIGNEDASDNISQSYEYELFSENNTEFSNDIIPQFHDVQKEEINFIISQTNESIFNNSTSDNDVAARAIDINNLRVGNLKDSSAHSGSPNPDAEIPSVVQTVVCSVLIFYSIL